MNFNLSPRCIWLTRHGESLDNIAGKIGKRPMWPLMEPAMDSTFDFYPSRLTDDDQLQIV